MKIERFILLALACAIPAFPPSTPGQEAGATVSQKGLFSYHAPPGWKVVTFPGVPNPISTDSQQDKPQPSIEVNTESSPKSLEDFAASSKESLKAAVPNSEFIEDKPFVTSAGVKGIRIVVRTKAENYDAQSIYYLFEGSKNVKFVVIAIGAAASFEKNAPLFDAAMKTFAPE